MAQDSKEMTARLMQTSRDWAAAAASGDLERTLAYWTEDAVVLPPDQPALVGKADIRAYLYSTASIPGFSITWEPEAASLSNDGEMGYMIERNRMTFADPAGATETRYGKAVTVWRKQADGSWKCVADTWNGNATERVFPAARGTSEPPA